MSYSNGAKGKAIKIDLTCLFVVPVDGYSDPKTLLDYTKAARNGKKIDLNTDNIFLILDELEADGKHYYVCLVGESNVAILSSNLGTVI